MEAMDPHHHHHHSEADLEPQSQTPPEPQPLELHSINLYGIRSFQPSRSEHADAPFQSVDFDHPITLIAGDNGSGKSAVLETVLFGATGDFATNCKRSLYHDPKIARVDVTFAKVNLTLRKVPSNSSEQPELVSMTWSGRARLNQKDDLPNCSTLGGVIKYGNQVEKYKAENMQAKAAEIIGLHSELLRYIHLCSSIDSLSALGESGAVKLMWDKILNLGDDIKHLQQLTNQEKLLNEKVPGQEIVLSALTDQYNKYVAKEADLKAREEEYQILWTRLAGLRDEKTMTEEILKKAKVIQGCQQNCAKLEGQIASRQSRVPPELLALNPEDMRTRLDSAKQEAPTPERLEQIRSELRIYEDKMEHFLKANVQHDLDCKNQKDQCAASAKNVAEICGTLNLDQDPTLDGSCDVLHLNSLVQQVQLQIDEAMTKKGQETESTSQLASKKEEELEAAKTKGTAIQTEVRMMDDDCQKRNRSLEESCALFKMSVPASQSQQHTQAFQPSQWESEFASQLASVDETLNLTKAEASANEDKKVEELRVKLELTKEELGRLSRRKIYEEQLSQHQKDASNISTKIESLRQSIAAEVDQVNRRHGQDEKISPESPVEEALLLRLAKVEEDYEQNVTESHRIAFKIREADDQTKALDGDMNQALRPAETLESALADISGSLKQAQKEESMLDSKIEYFQKLIADLSEACPTCGRSFDPAMREEQIRSIREMHETQITKLKAERDSGPLGPLRAQINTLLERRDILLSLKARKDVCPTSEAVQQYKSDLRKQDSTVNKLLETKLALKDAAEKCSDWIHGADGVNELKKKQEECSQKISDANANIAKIDTEKNPGLTLDPVEEKVKTEVKRLEEELETTKQQRKQEGKAVFSKFEEVQEQKRRLKSITAEKSKCEQLEATISQRRSDLRECVEEIAGFQSELRALQAELKNTETKWDGIIAEWTSRRTQLVNHINDHETFESRLADFVNLQRSNQQDKKRLEELQFDAKELTERAEIVQILEDSLALRMLKNQFLQLSQEFTQLPRPEGAPAVPSIELSTPMQLEPYEMAHREAIAGLSQAQGRLGQMDIEIPRLKVELKSWTAAAAYPAKVAEVENFRAELAHVREEVEKQDTKLLHAHKTRIDRINEILKRVWKQVYAGTDIEYVRIVSDSNPKFIPLKSATNMEERYKKLYNYRIVMCVGGVEVNLRERGSGGQKVLACLAIRIAAAEAEGRGKFNVLVVDDPTSCMDDVNVDLIVDSLIRLSHTPSESNQRPYQLVVTTQCREFLEKLVHRAQIPHYYWLEKPEPHKFSVISKKLSLSTSTTLQLHAESNPAANGNGETESTEESCPSPSGSPPRKRRSLGQ